MGKPASSPSVPVPGNPWLRVLAIAALIGVVESAVMVLLKLANGAWPFWLQVVLDAEIVVVSAVLLFWFVGVKHLHGQLAGVMNRIGSEQRLNADLKRALDEHALVSITDVNGKIIFANEKFCKVSGYTEAELLGQSHNIVNSAYHDSDYFKTLWQTIEQGRVWQGELRNRRKDGSHCWMDTTIIPFLDEHGTPYQYVAVRRDITDLKEAQMRAQRLGERLRWLLDASPSVIYANENPQDLTECTFVSGQSIVGYSPERMLAERGFWLEHLHPTDRADAAEQMDRLLETGQATLEYRFLDAAGQYRWICDHARVVRDGQGRVQAIVGSWDDITEGKAAERERLRLRRAAEASGDMILLTDAEGVIEYVNPAFCHFTGWESAQIVGRMPKVLRSGRTVPAVYHVMWETLLRGDMWRGRLLNRRREAPAAERAAPPAWQEGLLCRRKEDPAPAGTGQPDPLLYWADVTITPIRDEAGANLGFVSIQRDISETVAQEERLALNRLDTGARLAVVEILNQPAPLDERFGRVLDRLFDLPGLALQQKGGVFLRTGNADHLELFVLRGEFSDEFIRRERQIPLGTCLCGRAAAAGEVTVSNDCFCDARHDPSSAETASHGHYVVPFAAGGDPLGVLFLYTDPYPHYGADRIEFLRQVGEYMGLAVIREQTRHMVEQARDAALDASRQKSEFLANMSHEIRTPMNGVLGMLELLRDSPLTEEQQGFADMAALSAEMLLAIINSILDFSKIEAGKLDLDCVDFNLRSLVEDVCGLLASSAFAKGLELTCFIEPALPAAVRGDPTRLRQVITNLVGNAIKFTRQGEVSVAVACLSQDGGRAVLRFTVKDTGIGIAPADRQRLFNPFEQADGATTRRFGGTGLGLSISKSLLARMGGSDIQVDSFPGAGATFWFDIELEKQPAAAMVEDPPPILSRRKLLVVDDNATSRGILGRFLREWGASVDTAENAAQAWQMLRSARDAAQPFDLVVLDLGLPGMDGLALGRAMAQEEGLAQTPRILLNGGGSVSERERAAAGIRVSLAKPVRPSLLFDAVSQVLAEAEAKAKPSPAGSKRLHAAQYLAGRKVLLVEDNPVNQRVALKMLECLKVDARLAGNGREALAALELDACDWVLMDCHMPEMDGYAATRALRGIELGRGGARTPVIALTADALAGNREKCLDAGMDDCLVKPFMLDDLAQMLLRWLPPDGPDPPQAPAEPLWDARATLNMLGGDHGLLAEMKALFINEAPVQLARLQSDPAFAAEAAHALKGMAMHFHAQGVVNLAMQVEQKARAGGIVPADPLAGQLAAAVEALRAALEAA